MDPLCCYQWLVVENQYELAKIPIQYFLLTEVSSLYIHTTLVEIKRNGLLLFHLHCKLATPACMCGTILMFAPS
jgi:hypothetical protein